MAKPNILEGKGEDLQRHLQQYPNERFWLIPISNGTLPEPCDAPLREEPFSLDEEGRLFDELAALGKHLTVSPTGETYSRETIYSDHD